MKALSISIRPFWNCCLSPELSQFSCDTQAFSMYLEGLGYEITVHNPYRLKSKAKKIQYPIISTEELKDKINNFDLVFTRITPIHIRSFSGDLNWNKTPNSYKIAEAMKEYKGVIYNICVDYREENRHAMDKDKTWKVKKPERCNWDVFNPLKEMFNTKIIPAVPAPSGIFLKEKVFNHYTDLVRYTHNRSIVKEYVEEEKEFDIIYPGSSNLNPYRIDRLKTLSEGFSKVTIGKNRIKGWDSLTKGKNVYGKDYEELVRKSRISLVVADKWHNFRTLRFFESFINGSIIVVDNKYKSGCEFLNKIGLDNRIVENPDQIKSLITNSSYEDLYKEQLEKLSLTM